MRTCLSSLQFVQKILGMCVKFTTNIYYLSFQFSESLSLRREKYNPPHPKATTTKKQLAANHPPRPVIKAARMIFSKQNPPNPLPPHFWHKKKHDWLFWGHPPFIVMQQRTHSQQWCKTKAKYVILGARWAEQSSILHNFLVAKLLLSRIKHSGFHFIPYCSKRLAKVVFYCCRFRDEIFEKKRYPELLSTWSQFEEQKVDNLRVNLSTFYIQDTYISYILKALTQKKWKSSARMIQYFAVQINQQKHVLSSFISMCTD